MITKYANLSVSSSGGDGNSAGTAYGESEVASYLSSHSGDDLTLYLWGSTTSNFTLGMPSDVTNVFYVYPYLPSTNGPWRLLGTSTTIIGGAFVITGGIIDSDIVTHDCNKELTCFDTMLMRSMYIRSPEFHFKDTALYAHPGFSSEGCIHDHRGASSSPYTYDLTGTGWGPTIYMHFVDTMVLSDQVILKDPTHSLLAFVGGQLGITGTFVTNRSALKNDVTGLFENAVSLVDTTTFLEVGWSAPAFPAGDAVKEDFSSDTLTAGMTADVKLGTAPYTNYTTGLWGETRPYNGAGIGACYFEAGIIIPVWEATYPKAGTIGGTDVEILAQTDVDGNAYCVALPNGATAPTSQQVKDGEDSTGTPVAAGFAASTALVADTEANMFLANLTSETEYDIYVVAEGTGLQASPVLVEITTTDITNPINAAGYPKVNVIAETATSFLAKTNEAGNAYVVIVPRGAASPTSQQVKDGEDATGTAVVAGFSGSTALVANVDSILTTSNLTVGVRYDAYIACEDASTNLQATPTKVEFSTLCKIVSQVNVPKSYTGSFVIINTDGLIVTTDKIYPGAFTIEVVAGSQYEVIPYSALEDDGTKIKVKVLSATECLVTIKVNDGENDSNTFPYKITVVAGSEKPKSKPVGYAVDVTTNNQ